MAGVANFKGRQAAPYGTGGKKVPPIAGKAPAAPIGGKRPATPAPQAIARANSNASFKRGSAPGTKPLPKPPPVASKPVLRR